MASHEHTQVLSGDHLEVASSRHHYEGSDDYTNDSLTIIQIQDAQGRAFRPVWNAAWHELAPGISTRYTKDTQRVRLLAGACPVRIQFRSSTEYVSYSDPEFCRQSSVEYWVEYRTDA